MKANQLPAAIRLLQDAVRVEPSSIMVLPALRGALGLVVPLAVGVAMGQAATGLALGVGVLNVAGSDGSDPYRHRAERLLLAALASAVSAFAGAATSANDALAVCLLAIWGFAGGLLAAVRPAAAMSVVVPSIGLLVIFGSTPMPMTLVQAAVQAALVLGGGLMYAALALAIWPMHPFGPQRSALATVFRSLAASTRRDLMGAGGPVSTVEMTMAGEALAGMSHDGNEPEQLRIIFQHAERIRLELVALGTIYQQLAADDPAGRQVRVVLRETASVLDAAARALATRCQLSEPGELLRPVQTAVGDLERVIGGSAQGAVALKPATALPDHLRTVVALAAGETSALGIALINSGPAPISIAQRVRCVLGDVRAHLTLDSAAGRHAVRLTACLVLGDLAGRLLEVPRFYWMPMTVAIVLRPDFSTTFGRAIGRVFGTSLGVLLATLLMLGVGSHLWLSVAVAGLLAFVFLSTAPASMLLGATAVTAFVVVLASMTGSEAQATILDRFVNTVAGGMVAMTAYWIWPTWERSRTPDVLADMLDAYRRYFQAVMRAVIDVSSASTESIAATRRAARLARTEAETSMMRLRAEPELAADTSGLRLETAEGILANSHRFVRNAMALEAEIYQSSGRVPSAETSQFMLDVDRTMQGLIEALRYPAHAVREDLPTNSGLRIVAPVADPIVSSLNSMLALLRADGRQHRARPGPAFKPVADARVS